VLVVEDDDAARRAVARILASRGFRVTEAPDGVAALERVAEQRESVRLVISDVNMPRMGGAELRRRLAKSAPSLPVLLVSGYAEEALAEIGTLGGGVTLLRKPLEAAALLEAVVAALGDTDPRPT
jgi:CheY-like chemotaxis protein